MVKRQQYQQHQQQQLVFACLIIATLIGCTYCAGGRITGKTVSSAYGSRHKYYSVEPTAQQSSTNNGINGGQPSPASLTPKEYLDHKSGFSTFGIISVIFVIIVACLAFYYGIICYPLLCRDEKKYYTDGSSTITAATSCSIQSIDNYPDDQQKHIEQKNVF